MLPMLTALFDWLCHGPCGRAYLVPRSTSQVAAAMAIPPAPFRRRPPAPRPIVAGTPPLIPSGVRRRLTSGSTFFALRAGWRLAGLMFGRTLIDYTIQTVPPSSRSEFSFSWATGLLRRAPAGPQSPSVEAAERHDLLKRAYDVSDPVTGAVIGRFLPQGDDWHITDGLGRCWRMSCSRAPASIKPATPSRPLEKNVCRLVAVMGATAASAEVQIEFLPASDGRLERSLAVALAPIIEERARRARWT